MINWKGHVTFVGKITSGTYSSKMSVMHGVAEISVLWISHLKCLFNIQVDMIISSQESFDVE